MQYYAIGPCTRPFGKGEDNGGATAQGVTKDSILVVALIPPAAGDLSSMNGGIKNRLNWAPRVGATYQIDEKTVLRGGFGRSYDLGVFGSVFGHSVTQNLPVLSVQEINPAENFERVFTLAQGPPPPVFPAVPSNGRFALPDGVFARALPEKQRPPTVDADGWRAIEQRGRSPILRLLAAAAPSIPYAARNGVS